jgi:capsular polysaccharide biosynthesis protein
MENGRLISESIGQSGCMLYNQVQERLQTSPVKNALNINANTYLDLIPKVNSEIDLGFYLIRSGSYFHWVTEFLPNLRALKNYEETTGRSPTILIERNPPNWVLEYLQIAGYEDQVMPLPSQTTSVNELILPPRRIRIGDDYNPCSKDLTWVRDYFTTQAPTQEPDFANKIYISRDDADSRRVVNEKELIKELNTRGFESVILSELSIPEQINLFQEANYVVGAHGAGFTNIIFSNDTSIYELFPNNGIKHFYYCLANQLGFDYNYLVNPASHNRDMQVDVDTVIKDVDSMIDDENTLEY